VSKLELEEIPLPKGWTRAVRTALLHVISLAYAAIACARGRATRRRFGLRAQLEAERVETGMLRKEMGAKDRRFAKVPPGNRPHYTPRDRLEVLEVIAARGLTVEEGAARFQITATTLAPWKKRIDERGPDALVQTRVPINRFPKFVEHAV
jgi:hypothetical protein